ncbi:MAG: iron-containing alcohol dehydrogenase [Clostridium sp.]|jgi:alcohol dehydrogenase YqhD (iron-dependent ADH family)
MNSFVFENATRVYFGQGCVREQLAGVLGEFGETVLLAYGGGSIRKNGIYQEVMEALLKAGKKVVEFPGIMPNPTYKKMMEGKKAVQENGVDLILGVGGGSVMDCCKAISMAAATDRDVWEEFWINRGVVDFDPVPVGVVVTVVGTGSEVNGEGVITHEEQKIKTSRHYPRCNPKFAMLDPTYTYSVPPMQTAAGGFDMLSHVMETYFSEPDEDNISDGISETLMRTIVKNLPVAMKEPENYEARSNLMWTSTMAEIGIIKLGKKCDFEVHMIEHQMGAYTDCNHGMGLAVIHPAYYRRICRDGVGKFARFAREVWNISPEGRSEEELAFAGIDALEAFIRSLGLPTSLRELGFADRDVLKPIADSCILNDGGYRKLTCKEILEILEECW